MVELLIQISRSTGKERDTGGEDYFGARYFAFRSGRFLTPDWSATPQVVPYAQLGSPQSLNLYGYVQNNPVTGIDPDGHLATVEHSPSPYDDTNWRNLTGYNGDDRKMAKEESDKNKAKPVEHPEAANFNICDPDLVSTSKQLHSTADKEDGIAFFPDGSGKVHFYELEKDGSPHIQHVPADHGAFTMYGGGNHLHAHPKTKGSINGGKDPGTAEKHGDVGIHVLIPEGSNGNVPGLWKVNSDRSETLIKGGWPNSCGP